MTCDVISTGSKGNAVLLDGKYLFDCGIPFSKIKPYVKDLRAVFLTHIHLDHFRHRTIHEIHRRRPSVRFICEKNLLVPLVTEAGVDPGAICCVEEGDSKELWFTGHSGIIFSPFSLVHNVENYGWLVKIIVEERDNGRRLVYKTLYATDTHHIPIDASGLDLYMVESNYKIADLQARRARKLAAGAFSYEDIVEASHMSHEEISRWLARNAAPYSEVIFLHAHIDREGSELHE